MKREGRRVRKQGVIIWRTLTTLSLLTNLSLLLFFFLFAEGLSTVKRPLVALVFCVLLFLFFALQIGRASCRESVCQYVSISVVAVQLKTKHESTGASRGHKYGQASIKLTSN